MSIWTPPPTPDEAAREEDRVKVAQREDLAQRVFKLAMAVPPITDMKSRGRVIELCRILCSRGERFVVQREYTTYEVGRIISDVLLGPGIEYETKT